MVSASEPTTWANEAADPHRYSRRSSSVTISAENVENVVSPPRNPVVTQQAHFRRQHRVAGDHFHGQPIIRPPDRLAASVPSGSVGKTGLSIDAESPPQPRADRRAAAHRKQPAPRHPPSSLVASIARHGNASRASRRGRTCRRVRIDAQLASSLPRQRVLERGDLRGHRVEVRHRAVRAPVPVLRVVEIAFDEVHDAMRPAARRRRILLHDGDAPPSIRRLRDGAPPSR